MKTVKGALLVVFFGVAFVAYCATASAREIKYDQGEISIHVTPGEPTEIEFPGKISGGFRKKLSTLSLDRKKEDLVVFANEGLTEDGEAIIVRLDDGRSYPLRVKRATEENPRDAMVTVYDDRRSILATDEEDEPHFDRKFDRASTNHPAGLMREMVLATEFGKAQVAGYAVSERYRGEMVMDDGTLRATIDKIFIGPSLWGYVIDAHNQLDESQRLDPATFRLDGTRAISMDNWELAPRPLNIEHQIAGKHKAKIYVITTPRN